MKYHASVVHFAWLPTAMFMVRELALTLSCHVAANIVLHNVSLATCTCAQCHWLLLCWHNAQMLPCCNYSRFYAEHKWTQAYPWAHAGIPGGGPLVGTVYTIEQPQAFHCFMASLVWSNCAVCFTPCVNVYFCSEMKTGHLAQTIISCHLIE